MNEEKTISGIAAEMGFYDQSHFDKAFQKSVGISLSEYVHTKKMIAQGTEGKQKMLQVALKARFKYNNLP